MSSLLPTAWFARKLAVGATGAVVSSLVFAALPALAAAPGLKTLLGFQGSTRTNACQLSLCYYPPDTMGAIGTKHFFETANGVNSVYDRNTGSVLQRWSNDNFWTSKIGLTGSNGDQRVLFDHYTNRWIASGFSSDLADISIGISDTDDPLGSWKGVTFTGYAGGIADYPTLAIDDKAVYIGTNNFDATDVYQGASLFVIPRSDLFAAVPSVSSMSMFSSLVVDPVPLFTFQGAVNWQATPGNSANILAITSGWGNVMRMQALGVNASGATFTPASLVINLPSAVEIQPARQPDGTRLVDPLDDRISANVVQVNGKLYGVQTITLNTADYAQLHWFVLNASTGALIEDGFIGGDDYDYYQGSIAVNEWGNAVIGYNRSGGPEKGNDGRISFMAQAFRTDGLGGLDAFGTSVLLKRSEIDNYHCGPESPIDPNCRQRWGDYAAVTLDPLDHQRFWAIGEYAEGWQVLPNSPITDPRANWSTYIAALELEPAPVPLPILGVGGSFLWSRRLRRRIAVGTAGQRSSG